MAHKFMKNYLYVCGVCIKFINIYIYKIYIYIPLVTLIKISKTEHLSIYNI